MSQPHYYIKGSVRLKNTRDRLLILQRIKGISRKKLHQLREVDPLLQSIFTLSSNDIHQLLQVPQKKATEIYAQLQQKEKIQQLIKQDEEIAIILTIEDGLYPHSLMNIPDAPLVLYAIGDLSLLQTTKLISVIGTRKPSSEARNKLNYVITPLIESGYVIVSGLAYGIDSFAHERALEYGGKTITVLGSGFHHIYPKQNIALCRQIARSGLVLSEYAPHTRPRPFHFPERNRIISGLSMGTLVIEATERSGTLITVDQALDQGREVYAVPGSPLIPQTKGCHQLIQDGAKLAMNATDILEDWEGIQIHS